MHRTYLVHMLAFCETPPKGFGPTAIRPVRVPLEQVAEALEAEDREAELSQIFYFGQNDFCEDRSLTQSIPSVSAGDVVEFSDGEFWMYRNVGYAELTPALFEHYRQLPRRDRHFFDPTMDFDKFLQRIGQGYYSSSDNGAAQFKADVLSHYGTQHEDTFRRLWAEHADLDSKGRLEETLGDFVKEIT